VWVRVLPLSPRTNRKHGNPLRQQPGGYRSAVVSTDGQALLAVGPNGSDISIDAGLHWKTFTAPSLNALFTLDSQHVYAAGGRGTVAQFQIVDAK